MALEVAQLTIMTGHLLMVEIAPSVLPQAAKILNRA